MSRDLYSQWLAAGGPSVGPASAIPGWKKYEGSLPQANYVPTPPAAPVPFWDMPSASLDPQEFNFSPWDKISFGGQLFPGRARVRTKKPKRIDVKLSKGKDSATLTYTGYRPAEIDITLAIWTQPQYSLLATLMQMLLQKPGVGKRFSGIDVSYPSLALINIRSLVIASVGTLEPGEPHGLWQMQIQAFEYTAPTKADVTTTAKSSSTFHVIASIKSGVVNQSGSLPNPAQTDTGPNRR